MWKILIALALGIGVGAFVPISDVWKVRLGKLQFFGLLLLLLFMGIAIGINKQVVANIKAIGLISLSFAVLSTGLSIVLAYLATEFYLRTKSKNGGA